jgi:hypothetical protein
MPECEYCDDTGYYGDNGPGIDGNTEYHPCDQCVLTTGKDNRQYKVCKCKQCGYTAQCTPWDDFYTLKGDDNGFLYCEYCFRSAANQLDSTD